MLHCYILTSSSADFHICVHLEKLIAMLMCFLNATTVVYSSLELLVVFKHNAFVFSHHGDLSSQTRSEATKVILRGC